MRRLCVSIAEPSVANAVSEARAFADRGAIVEIRLDAFDRCDALDASRLAPFASLANGAECIWTFRRPHDGGRVEVPDAFRIGVLASIVARFGGLVDVEVELAATARSLGIKPEQTILSHHDFAGTPPDLVDFAERMALEPAAIYKLATFAARTSDQFPHFDVLARARSVGRRAVSLAMGEKGVATRVLGPSRGGAFTYCAASAGREVAPGQVSFGAMRDVYRADEISDSTIVTGLVAGSVGYSRSPVMHNRAARDLGVDMVYVPFAVDDLQRFLEALPTIGMPVRGFSVTNPFKTEVLGRLERVDPLVARVGAANTIVADAEGWVGYNTDVAGAMAPLDALVGDLRGKRVGVVGAGGAARAILCGLQDRGAFATVFARDSARASAVARDFAAECRPISDVAVEPLDVLVNATPLGTSGVADTSLPVPEAALRRVGLVYDLVYNPEETAFLAAAKRAGCATLGGLPMLATQAALQFELFTGRVVEPDRMLAYARSVSS